MKTLVAAVVFCSVAGAAAAQPAPPSMQVNGQVTTLGLLMPDRDATELRSRVQIEATVDPAPWLRLRIDGEVDALVASRDVRVNTARVRARDVWAEWRGERGELRVGHGRLIWGRLDEIMPSDVLNPIDSSRYFLEGRAEARLPVTFARGRLFLNEATTVEGVVSLPGRRGRFDLLDEDTSPFNLLRDVVVPATTVPTFRREEPQAAWNSLQYGGRVSTTVGRVDVSTSVYRGVEAFGVITFEPLVQAAPSTAVVGSLVERYPRFTMIAADAEAVIGAWAFRAETAYFPDRTMTTSFGAVEGRVIESGVGVDRSAGDYRLFGSIVWHRDWTLSGVVPANDDLSLIGSVERRFAREKYMVRVFAVVNPIDASSFVRALAGWAVRDNVGVEVSGGVLTGDAGSTDTLSRFRERDFAFARVRWLF